MVVGLGNPGPDYQRTRHNAGFWFVEHWAGLLGLSFRKAWFRPFAFATCQFGDDRLVLVKPLTFVNRSGQVLPTLLKRFRAQDSDVLVVFDQMDLPPGRVRLKPHGSHAGHNGLRSVDAALGHDRYHRLAVGVGRPARADQVIDHVLGVPSDPEWTALQTVLGRVVPAANASWSRGWGPLVDAVNQRDANSP